MKKVVKKIKKPFVALVETPVYGIAAIVVLVLLLGAGAALLFTGGEDDETTQTATEKGKSKKKDPGIEAAKKRKVKPAPVRRKAGTLDTARSVGRLAIAQARGRLKNPSGVNVRVSAAPKQTVIVTWQLACYNATGKSHTTRVKNGRYRTKPPDTRSLPLPLSGADECIASITAGLTRTTIEGRIKVAVIAG